MTKLHLPEIQLDIRNCIVGQRLSIRICLFQWGKDMGLVSRIPSPLGISSQVAQILNKILLAIKPI